MDDLLQGPGETVEVGPNGMLRGRCKVSASPGSHGNLGTRSVDAGDIVVIPAAIGEFVGEVTPIPIATAGWMRGSRARGVSLRR